MIFRTEPIWYQSWNELWLAVLDLDNLGSSCIKLLDKVIETQGLTRKTASKDAENLYDNGFVFIREKSYWSKEVEIRPALWGEEAMEVHETLVELLPKSKKVSELTELQFEILRYAINISRNEQIKCLSILKCKLKERWPNKSKSIKAAIQIWANRSN